jgi:hypothetical protein
VRALWNANSFNLSDDSDTNVRNFERWSQGWRRNQTETYLQQGARR